MGPAGTFGAEKGRADITSARPATPKNASSPKSTRRAKADDIAGEPASRRALRSQGRKTMRKLLDAAMVVFARRGYHAARVDDIVKLAKTSHGTFYLYFSNKEDLLRALAGEAGEVVAALDNALGPVGPDHQGWRELRRWMEGFSEAWQRYAPVLRAWTDLAMSDAELSAQGHAAAGGVARTLAGRIAETGPQPGIDPNAAAEAVVAMVDRFHYLRQFTGEPVDASALDTLTTMVHRALFAGGSPPPESLAAAGSPPVSPKKARSATGTKKKS
ncbi:MAG TPA: TetR/AcrR family transcriptional regulator [Acidimicrobiales bacterium]|nr:TetR/AcrR family transcriptional regulator [Acidimicrobiales bacterium]